MAKLVKNAGMTMDNFFELIDKHNRGYISSVDFKNCARNMSHKLDENEIEEIALKLW